MAVRQATIARQTLALADDRTCLARYAGPCRQKTSARVTGDESTDRGEQFQGRGIAGQRRAGEMEVARSRRQMTMAEESADAVEIDAGLEQVRGEGMGKTVDTASGAMPAALRAA